MELILTYICAREAFTSVFYGSKKGQAWMRTRATQNAVRHQAVALESPVFTVYHWEIDVLKKPVSAVSRGGDTAVLRFMSIPPFNI